MDPRRRGVLFDLDGVLLQTSEHHRRSWQRLAAELGAVFPDELFWRTFGQTNATILPQFLGREIEADEARRLSERKEMLFREEARGRITLFPGAVELIRALRERGFRTALATSTPASNVAFYEEELGLTRFFDASTSADDVARGKPDPEVFLLAAKRIDVPPAGCAVIEDAVAGVQAAKAAGMKCVAVTTTTTEEELCRRASPDLVVAGLGDLNAEALKRLLW